MPSISPCFLSQTARPKTGYDAIPIFEKPDFDLANLRLGDGRLRQLHIVETAIKPTLIDSKSVGFGEHIYLFFAGLG